MVIVFLFFGFEKWFEHEAPLRRRSRNYQSGVHRRIKDFHAPTPAWIASSGEVNTKEAGAGFHNIREV